MGRGEPGVWTAVGQVDALTGLAPASALAGALAEAMAHGELAAVTVVVAELESPRGLHPLEPARRLALAGEMARAAFGSAIVVGRLGASGVGVLTSRDPDLCLRAGLWARMVHDLPGKVSIHPLPGGPDLAVRALARLGRS